MRERERDSENKITFPPIQYLDLDTSEICNEYFAHTFSTLFFFFFTLKFPFTGERDRKLAGREYG